MYVCMYVYLCTYVHTHDHSELGFGTNSDKNKLSAKSARIVLGSCGKFLFKENISALTASARSYSTISVSRTWGRGVITFHLIYLATVLTNHEVIMRTTIFGW